MQLVMASYPQAGFSDPKQQGRCDPLLCFMSLCLMPFLSVSISLLSDEKTEEFMTASCLSPQTPGLAGSL